MIFESEWPVFSQKQIYSNIAEYAHFVLCIWRWLDSRAILMFSVNFEFPLLLF